MAEAYSVVALIPTESDFSISKAVSHYRVLGRCEPITTSSGGSGFRLWFGSWSITASLEDSPHVLPESMALADTSPPFNPEVLSRCTRRLSVWSDDDRKGEHSGDWLIAIQHLQREFGLLVRDEGGEWWGM